MNNARSQFSAADESFMRRALGLADRAKGATFPNPAVGAVVVDAAGRVVGEGATGVCGGPHAERRALKQAGGAAAGATMYVTLEPCSHFGRTPPCVDAVIEAGVGAVVAAVKDPNPLVNGKGLRRLRARGVAVRTGLLGKEAALVNEDFFWAVANRRPWVALKLAMTLDGRIADCGGGSKWITSAASRQIVQDIRRRHGAIGVGSGTLAADDPKLTARCGRKTYYPARIVFSSTGNIPKGSYFMTHTDEARSIVVVKNNNKSKRKKGIERRGVEYWYTGASDDAESIDTFLDMAYAEGINSILIEGGQRLASAFLENGFVNKLYLFYGGRIFGDGLNGLSFSRGLTVNSPLVLGDVSYQRIGDDLLATGYIKNLTF
ncbi:MAG: bifunctional diaminohydroxyphosphoribosylaminopyrimidine deaminase/5-amino-6-(5-phosphoribosylamino)uracil reductase RibD [Chitinispirillales bacterium]|nr:bifunctional diaminohydroxyphosphoribosylaminopyrimidine deaminase/5-amino-6-(5-phosphoribosylamino)uracil reductase RibD [Chitinispirillales bacterium]